MRKFSGRGAAAAAAKGGQGKQQRLNGGKDNVNPSSFPLPLRASRAAAEVLPQLDALRRAATQRSKGWLLPAIASLKAPRTNVHVLQRSVLAPRAPLVAFLREFGGDDYFDPPVLSSSTSTSSSSSSSSAAYAEVRRAYVETLSAALERHLRRYVAAVSRLADRGDGCSPPLVGTGARPQIPPSSAAHAEPGGGGGGGGGVGGAASGGSAVAGALAAFVDAVAHTTAAAARHHHHSPSSSSSSSSSRSLDAAERGAILLHLDRPALVPGATAAASGGTGGARAGEGGSGGVGPSTPMVSMMRWWSRTRWWYWAALMASRWRWCLPFFPGGRSAL